MGITVHTRVNGRPIEREVEARQLLVYFLRDELGLTGTHVGCDTSQCGACTVWLDGRAVKSCTVLAAQVDGHEVTTVEGLAETIPESQRIEGMHPVQAGFWEKHGLQCGFCTPGMMMNAAELLAHSDQLSESEIREALEGNICRCTGYQDIVDAIIYAAEKMGVSVKRDEVAPL